MIALGYCIQFQLSSIWPGPPEKRLDFFTLTKNPSAAGRNRKRVLIQNWLPMPRRDMKNRQRKTAEAASGQLSAAKFAA